MIDPQWGTMTRRRKIIAAVVAIPVAPAAAGDFAEWEAAR